MHRVCSKIDTDKKHLSDSIVRFLIDAQLPKSLSNFLATKGYDSIHTIDLPDKNNTKDYQIIALSKQDNRIIITKDNDFLESFLLKKEPEKLILVKTGNISNTELLEIFDNNFNIIVKSIQENSLIEITMRELIVHV